MMLPDLWASRAHWSKFPAYRYYMLFFLPPQVRKSVLDGFFIYEEIIKKCGTR
jgi:hypothetical protein